MKRNFSLDLLRAAAILGVTCFHSEALPGLPVWLRQVFLRGYTGVDLFFVLSGYLIAGQLFSTPADERPATTLGQFWVRRWTRTFPLYFLVLFFYVAVKPYALASPFTGFSWRWLFFLQNTRLME